MNCDKCTTKDRLLDAAEELFLSKGFEAVSIRELAAAADVNIAAVNYHFQGKENLYHEVIRRRFTHQRDLVIGMLQRIDEEHDGRPPLEDVVRGIVSLHLSSALSPEPAGHWQEGASDQGEGMLNEDPISPQLVMLMCTSPTFIT